MMCLSCPVVNNLHSLTEERRGKPCLTFLLPYLSKVSFDISLISWQNVIDCPQTAENRNAKHQNESSSNKSLLLQKEVLNVAVVADIALEYIRVLQEQEERDKPPSYDFRGEHQAFVCVLLHSFN